MSAIITEKFRQHNARNFFESFSEASADVYYLFLGKATPFTTGTTGGSDSSPSTPADSVSREFYNWDSMLGAKKITSSDIALEDGTDTDDSSNGFLLEETNGDNIDLEGATGITP